VSVVEDFLEANKQFAARFHEQRIPMIPTRKVAILTCMDARLDLFAILGLHDGDAHIIRNAGGRAQDAIRSLAISQEMLGTREIVVIHHTNCGLATFTNESFRERLGNSLGPEAEMSARLMEFAPFEDVDQGLIDDVDLIRESPILRPDTIVSGLLYDVDTGELRQVV
jgi:carbonic anhydrase